MFKHKGKNHYSPQEAAKKFKVPLPTIYYWIQAEKVELLDLEEACKNLPIEPSDLRAQSYIEEESLVERVKELKGNE